MDENRKDLPYDEELVMWKDLPPWMKDNEFIITSYRKATHSYTLCLRTISKLHNETVNIWTHLLGAALFALSLHQFLTHSYPLLSHAPTLDVFAVSIYYLSVVNCFILSTSFHTFSNHSSGMHSLGNSLDHIGVVLVIYGSSLPATHFLFRCPSQFTLRTPYSVLSAALTVLSAIFTLRPQFRTPAYRRVRFNMYSLLGLSTFLPILHGTLIYPVPHMQQRMSLTHFLGLAVLNFAGAAIYAARIPERWFPRTFDICGSSHQIMHVLVVMGALSHEKGLLNAVAWWQSQDARGSCPN